MERWRRLEEGVVGAERLMMVVAEVVVRLMMVVEVVEARLRTAVVVVGVH